MNDPKTQMTEQTMEVEQYFVGALLKDPSKVQAVSEIITPDDIWLDRAREFYKAILALHERGLCIDTVTVGDELERHGSLGEFGGRLGLQRIREEFRGDAPESYAHIILDYSAKRRMIEEGNNLVNWGYNGRNSSEIQADSMKRIADIRTPNTKADKHLMTVKQAVSIVYDNVDNAARLALEGKTRDDILPTGFIDLDRMYNGGVMGSDLIVIAGRPGQGKSSFLLTVAKHLSFDKRKRGLFCGLEMSNEQTTTRLLSMLSGVTYGALMEGKLQDNEWPLLTHAVERAESMPLILQDMPSITVNQIRQVYRAVEAKYGRIDYVMVDYLQLQGTDVNYKVRELEVASISRGLKAMAKEFDIPVFAAAQLSRATELRSEKRPVLSDLRESGAIENDADSVWFIYRPDQYEKDTAKQNIAEIIVAKHRNGAVGSVELMFRPSITKFENATTRVFNVGGAS